MGIERNSMGDNANRLLKVLGGISAAIILGAIGSGVWARILSPFIDWVYIHIINIINTVYTGNKDSIYLAATQGFNDRYSIKTLSFVSMIIPLVCYTYLTFKLLELRTANICIRTKKNGWQWGLLGVCHL
jgi:hypothetical protein